MNGKLNITAIKIGKNDQNKVVQINIIDNEILNTSINKSDIHKCVKFKIFLSKNSLILCLSNISLLLNLGLVVEIKITGKMVFNRNINVIEEMR